MVFLRLIFILLVTAEVALAEIKIVDGDTFDLDETRIRLNGIDAPEVGQKCRDASGAQWDCGRAATDALFDLTQGREISCEFLESDQYDRKIANCAADGVDIGSSMIERGLAWAYTTYSDRYVGGELSSKAKKIGIWQGDAQPPWEHRAARWSVAAQDAPEGCPIKGNISSNGKIYHVPWSPWYSRTRVSVEKGERWFCDEAEATAAGWRAPYWK